jgi:hypothetical protein
MRRLTLEPRARRRLSPSPRCVYLPRLLVTHRRCVDRETLCVHAPLYIVQPHITSSNTLKQSISTWLSVQAQMTSVKSGFDKPLTNPQITDRAGTAHHGCVSELHQASVRRESERACTWSTRCPSSQAHPSNHRLTLPSPARISAPDLRRPHHHRQVVSRSVSTPPTIEASVVITCHTPHEQ